MKYIAVTLEGIEDVAKDEIDSILGTKSKNILKQRVQFETDKINKLARKARSINTIYMVLKRFRFKSKKEILSEVSKLDFSFIKEDFAARCSRTGIHKFNSFDITLAIGKLIHKKGYDLNLKSNTLVYVDIFNNDCLVGILIKDRLCKRDYRLRISNKSVNACLAFALLKISDCQKTDVLLDPFCKDGVIAIEAFLSGSKKVYASDELSNNVYKTKINSKLAKARIKINNYGIDWLDTKFKEKSIDKIITVPPILSKRSDKEAVEKSIKELFYQSKYVLKDTLTVITTKDWLIRKYYKQYSFKLVSEREVKASNQQYNILIFKKQ